MQPCGRGGSWGRGFAGLAWGLARARDRINPGVKSAGPVAMARGPTQPGRSHILGLDPGRALKKN